MSRNDRLNSLRVAMVCCLLSFVVVPMLLAQEAEEVADFFKKGLACYEKRDLVNAALEFENVLMLDPGHLDAKIWLVKVYGDRREFKKAQDMLKLAESQSPSNAEIKELLKLYGLDKPAKVTKKEPDLVRHEVLTLLGNRVPPRQFGLVIPETKVKKVKPPLSALADIGSGPDEIEGEAGGEDPSKALEELNEKKEEGPLVEVFDVWALEGLNPALEKYFEVVGQKRALGLYDDKGLLREGYAFFKPRFTANPQDDEGRYFFGMITFFNGDIDASREMLTPIRSTKFGESPGAKAVFKEFDRIKAAEDARIAAKKRAEEEVEARRKAVEEARLQAEEERRQTQAALASAAANASGTETVSAAPPGSAEAIDNEGYEMYKKGQLDQAIEKYQEAIKVNAQESKVFYHLGLALTDKALAGNVDSFDRAIEAFNSVMRLAPGSKLARDAEIMIRDISAAKNSMRP